MECEEHLQAAEKLVTKLCGISDVKQRSYAIASRLQTLEDERVVALIKIIRERALLGHGGCLAVYNGLLQSGSLADVLGRSRLMELVETAQRLCEYEVVAILSDLPPQQKMDSHSQPFLDPDLKEVPLGARKALARKLDFKLMRRIARDQDHRVIRILLNNPRLTEMDVTRIAATRPASPKVLEEIYDHPRWISRYTVKKVLVLNPYTPLSISLRLLAFMLVQDLEEICRSPDLDPVLHEQARRIAEKKSALHSDDEAL